MVFPLCVSIILYCGKGDGFFVVLPSYYGMQFSVDINCLWYYIGSLDRENILIASS